MAKKKRAEMKPVLVLFPKGLLEKLDLLIPQVYPSRNEAIRLAVADLVKTEWRNQRPAQQSKE